MDSLHVKRNRIVGINYLGIIDAVDIDMVEKLELPMTPNQQPYSMKR